MSNAIRSPVGIILVVFVAMLGHPLACNAVNAPYLRKSIRAQPMVANDNGAVSNHWEIDHISSPKEGSNFMDAARNNYAPKKCRDERAKAKDKFFSWLNYTNALRQKQLGQHKQDLLKATREREREVNRQLQRMERIQNEAADHQFERLVLSSGQHRVGDHVDQGLSIPATRDEAMIYNVKAKAFCNVLKPKVQHETSTASPIWVTTTPAAPTRPTPKCASDGTNGRPTVAKRLLKIFRRMKKRALLIIKTLNVLDSEIALGEESAHFTTSPMPQGATQKTTECWQEASLNNKCDYNEKERLEPPTPNSASMVKSQYSQGFYFEPKPPGDVNTKENMAAALQEEEKLEQKVREEYQMEHANFEPETERLREKLNRAHYESAPAAAARLEYVLTNPLEKHLAMNGITLPKTQISQKPAGINNKMSDKRNLLRKQHMNINKSNTNKQILFGSVLEEQSTLRDQRLSENTGSYCTHCNKIHYKRKTPPLHPNNTYFAST